jgi:hypothetical protein
MQLHTSANAYKCVGNIPGSRFVKAFSALPSHSLMSISSHKNHLFYPDFSGGNRSKLAAARSRDYE